jgi:hypothetical protein
MSAHSSDRSAFSPRLGAPTSRCPSGLPNQPTKTGQFQILRTAFHRLGACVHTARGASPASEFWVPFVIQRLARGTECLATDLDQRILKAKALAWTGEMHYVIARCSTCRRLQTTPTIMISGQSTRRPFSFLLLEWPLQQTAAEVPILHRLLAVASVGVNYHLS